MIGLRFDDAHTAFFVVKNILFQSQVKNLERIVDKTTSVCDIDGGICLVSGKHPKCYVCLLDRTKSIDNTMLQTIFNGCDCYNF
jgi:hypothetical protein